MVFEFCYFLYYSNGMVNIPAEEITTMTLKNPNMPAVCEDETMQNFETLMADQSSGDVYLIQKNIYHPDVTIYKVM